MGNLKSEIESSVNEHQDRSWMQIIWRMCILHCNAVGSSLVSQ